WQPEREAGRRRDARNYRDGLRTSSGITTAIAGYPSAGDALRTGAVSESADHVDSDISAAAQIVGGWRIESPFTAADDRLIAGAGDYRRRGIHVGNIYAATVTVAATVAR